MKGASQHLLESLAIRVASLNRDLKPESIDPDVGLLDAGYVDSLAMADFVAGIEGEYGVAIDADRLLGDLYSLRALADWIAAYGNPPK